MECDAKMDREIAIIKWLAFGLVVFLLWMWLWSSLELKTHKIQDVTISQQNCIITCYKKEVVEVPKFVCFGSFLSILPNDEVKYVPLDEHTGCETNIEREVYSNLKIAW